MQTVKHCIHAAAMKIPHHQDESDFATTQDPRSSAPDAGSDSNEEPCRKQWGIKQGTEKLNATSGGVSNPLWGNQNIVIDGDAWVKSHSITELQEWIDGSSSSTEFIILLNESDKRRSAKFAKISGITIFQNDYTDSPYKDPRTRYGEVSLERVKRLSATLHISVSVFVGDAVKTPEGFARSGISYVNARDVNPDNTVRAKGLPPSPPAVETHIVSTADQAPISESSDLDLFTQSHETEGNRIEFFFDNVIAKQKMLALFDTAYSFIAISSYALHNDPVGREIAEHLIKAANRGIQIKLLLEEVSQAPFPSEYGYVWLDEEIQEKLRTHPNIEWVYNDIHEKPHGLYPGKSTFTRHHRKVVLIDSKNSSGNIDLIAFGGGRFLSAHSFENVRAQPKSLPDKLMGIGKGTFMDMNYAVTGPITEQMLDVYNTDFLNAGGKNPIVFDTSHVTKQEPSNSDTTLRYITHDTYTDQNCQNAVMGILSDPNSKTATIVNFFTPTEQMIVAMEEAAKTKQVDWYLGDHWYNRENKMKIILRLLKAGVQVHMSSRALHTKLYANDFYYAFGNHNMDVYSLQDDEDLMMMDRKEDASAPLDEYIESLNATCRLIQWHEGMTITELTKQIDALPFDDSLPIVDTNRENKFVPAMARLSWMFMTLPFR